MEGLVEREVLVAPSPAAKVPSGAVRPAPMVMCWVMTSSSVVCRTGCADVRNSRPAAVPPSPGGRPDLVTGHRTRPNGTSDQR